MLNEKKLTQFLQPVRENLQKGRFWEETGSQETRRKIQAVPKDVLFHYIRCFTKIYLT